MTARVLALALIVATACTSATPEPAATPTPTGSPAPSPTLTRTRPPPVPTFSVRRVLATIEAIADVGPREAASRAYARAADLVASRFEALGYRVRRQRFPVPAGRVDGVAVGAGESQNVVAEPRGFDPRAPHLLVGGHLDTVPDTAGANDNASGVAVVLELARLVARAPVRLPVVFVALGAEERRRRSPDESAYALGARAYIDDMGRRARDAMRGFLNVDMVGAGSIVHETGRGRIDRIVNAVARRLDIPIAPIVTDLFSDHVAFDDADLPHAWLWAGEHPTLHEPADTPAVIKRAQVRRVGRLAWETLRRF